MWQTWDKCAKASRKTELNTIWLWWVWIWEYGHVAPRKRRLICVPCVLLLKREVFRDRKIQNSRAESRKNRTQEMNLSPERKILGKWIFSSLGIVAVRTSSKPWVTAMLTLPLMWWQGSKGKRGRLWRKLPRLRLRKSQGEATKASPWVVGICTRWFTAWKVIVNGRALEQCCGPWN